MRLVAFFQFISSVGATGGSNHSGCSPAASATHLVADNPANDGTHDGARANAATADTGVVVPDEVDGLHDAVPGVSASSLVRSRVRRAVVGWGHGAAPAECQQGC